jgi:predicted transcriptional regulator
MQVHFPPDLEGKLNRIAAEQGKNSEALVCEAVERLVGYDEWFVREVEKGIAAADRGEFVEHRAVLAMIDERYPDIKG